MSWTRCAILARCGSRAKAFQYCMNVATEYPRLTREYSELALSFGTLTMMLLIQTYAVNPPSPGASPSLNFRMPWASVGIADMVECVSA